jgi:hypothetical protein
MRLFGVSGITAHVAVAAQYMLQHLLLPHRPPTSLFAGSGSLPLKKRAW